LFHPFFLLLFFGIRDPGSWMGKNQDQGSGINIQGPQHCFLTSVSNRIRTKMSLIRNTFYQILLSEADVVRWRNKSFRSIIVLFPTVDPVFNSWTDILWRVDFTLSNNNEVPPPKKKYIYMHHQRGVTSATTKYKQLFQEQVSCQIRRYRGTGTLFLYSPRKSSSKFDGTVHLSWIWIIGYR
jgi:hypothetical protein